MIKQLYIFGWRVSVSDTEITTKDDAKKKYGLTFVRVFQQEEL
jgi:hypothetical protein